MSKMSNRALMVGALVGVLTMTASITQAQVSNVFNMPTGQTSMQFVTVGNPGNAADSNGYGSVGYTYQMAKYDVTVGQYCQFLNAVAQTDTYGLYNGYMDTNMPTIAITQNGGPGSYSYVVTGSYSAGVNCPIFDVSWGDAARFCNWLENGQPVGPEGNGTTETGAYTLNGAVTTSALMAITRNAGATYVIPSMNEWYKAAYYKGGSTNAGYWLYPTQSNTAPVSSLPDTGNHANFASATMGPGIVYTDPVNHLTPVGTFTLSPGPYGTFDQGGNLYQWTELPLDGSMRAVMGGSWADVVSNLQAHVCAADDPAMNYGYNEGFRVAEVPEPGSITLVVCGGLCLLAYAWRRRRRTA